MTPRPRISLDITKRREVCAILAVGGSRVVAARYVGCSVTTIYRTALRDDEFREQLRHAVSQHELAHLNNIQSAAKLTQHWRAAAWLLERRYPQRYRARPVDAVTAEELSPVLEQMAEIVVREVTNPADRRRIRAKLRRLTSLAVQRRRLRDQVAASSEPKKAPKTKRPPKRRSP